jgi:hypothetical protein
MRRQAVGPDLMRFGEDLPQDGAVRRDELHCCIVVAFGAV